MSKHRLFAIISICLLAVTSSLAGVRTEREMLSVAQRQLTLPTMARGTQMQNWQIDKLLDAEQYCVYGQREAGFVVVSRNDRFPAVMGYSTSSFDANRMPCGMAWWLNTMSTVMDQKANASESVIASATPVAPLVSTQWGQGDPYNFLTPLIQGEHAPTGCVATAMAQLMKFFNYPAQGKGSGYYTLNDNDTHIPATISSTYDWEHMRLTYGNSKLSDEERLPVAQLMSDAGIASYMNYGSNSSGALELNATRGFIENFSYHNATIRCYHRDFFSDEDWMALVYDELKQGIPILYCGSDAAQGGHAFVVDGVDENGLVHVNWGWDGSCDGYYNINDLSPTDEHSVNHGHFTDGQSMVFRLRAHQLPLEGISQESFWGTYESSYALTGGKKRLSVDLPLTYNFHFEPYTGPLYLVLQSTDNPTASKQVYNIGQADTYMTYYGFSAKQMVLTTQLTAGQYKAYMASKADFDLDYQPIHCLGGAICYMVTVEADGTNSVSEPLPMGITTGITNVQQDSQRDARLFDLQGRHITMPGKGLYIRNGHKVLLP